MTLGVNLSCGERRLLTGGQLVLGCGQAVSGMRRNGESGCIDGQHRDVRDVGGTRVLWCASGGGLWKATKAAFFSGEVFL